MVPYCSQFRRGEPMPSPGTTTGDTCYTCGRRFTVMHIIAGSRVCGECVETSYSSSGSLSGSS